MYVDPDGNAKINIFKGIKKLGKWVKKHAKEIAIGATFIVAGALITALTAGTGVPFLASFGSALLSSATQVGISMLVGIGTNGVLNIINGNDFFDGFGDTVASSFMWGGIFAGGAQILSGVFNTFAKLGVETGRKGGFLETGNLSPDRIKSKEYLLNLKDDGQKFVDYGGTLFKIGKVHIDVSIKSYLHLCAFGYKHIPIGTYLAGIIGGI